MNEEDQTNAGLSSCQNSDSDSSLPTLNSNERPRKRRRLSNRFSPVPTASPSSAAEGPVVTPEYRAQYAALFDIQNATLKEVHRTHPRQRLLQSRSHKTIRLDSPHRLFAATIYERGDILLGDDRCTECKAGRGVFASCAVLEGLAANACSSCKYKAQGRACSKAIKLGKRTATAITTDGHSVDIPTKGSAACNAVDHISTHTNSSDAATSTDRPSISTYSISPAIEITIDHSPDINPTTGSATRNSSTTSPVNCPAAAIDPVAPALLRASEMENGWKERLKDSVRDLSFLELWNRKKALDKVLDEVLESLIANNKGTIECYIY